MEQEELAEEKRHKIKTGQKKAEYYKEQMDYYRLKFAVEKHANRTGGAIGAIIKDIFLTFILGSALMWVILSISESLSVEPMPQGVVVATTLTTGSFLGIFGGIFLFLMQEVDISDKKEKLRQYMLLHAQEETEEDLFKNSIQTSYKYLDRYYDQTQRQAQQGFHITVFIAVCGALLIFGGVIAMYFGFIQPAYITCASGAITELISAIFFYLYNKTVTSMSRYHNKLVLSQNISFALRVADSLENNKDDAKLAIIKELVKDVNAQMMKSDADDAEPPKKKQSDAEKPSDAGTQS